MSEPENSYLRWLHLTDLHMGTDSESQKIALASLVSSITHYSNQKPFDLVLLTGDLAFSGQKDQYDQIESQLIAPLRATALCRNAQFIAVPGNHDLNCDIELPPSWKEIGPKRQEKFFHLGDDGRRTRGSRPQAFSEYSHFVRRSGIHSVDPLKEPAAIFQIKTSGKEVAIISVVTAFFSDKDTPDRQKAPAPVHPIRALAQGRPDNVQLIVIGHHPPEWFLADSQQHLHSLLVEKNAFYLHGHEHRTQSKFGSRGLAQLGFGAAYQSPQDSKPKPYYRNSFAICELTSALHVCVVSWDSEHGQWRPDLNLPGDFIDRSDRLADGYVLNLPSTKLTDRTRPYASIGAAIRKEVQIDRCLWLAGSSPTRWARLLETMGVLHEATEVYTLPTQSLPTGHLQFRVRDTNGQYLVHAISAHGDLLNFEQLQAINTELDRQAFEGCIVATLGELSTEAHTLATQLSSRKLLTILERREIVRRSIRNLPAPLERAIYAASNADALAGCLIFTDTGCAVLLSERTSNLWFRILDERGDILTESAELVLAVRREFPPLRTQAYEDSDSKQPTAKNAVGPQFDRGSYLEKCYSYFDDVKYAPLAALGFRFRKASLSNIYVEASADVGGTTKSTHNLGRAITEFIESLKLPKAQQEQLQAQMRSRYGLNRSVEVGAARRLYQRYNNVVVLGDPGSGKTCFVQYEILAYCKPASGERTWYSQHLPIYVPLAEAARLFSDRLSLLAICEILSARRGIDLPCRIIEQALADGQAAFFFDGLDEVGYVDKRIALLTEIDSLVKTFAARGNRFVLSSRPAAVQPVDIPDGLTFLQLKGLTEGEIRTLASRVLTTRLGESPQDQLAPEEDELVARLLEDTRNQPGIARIARNPLLLTLLVLIYANSGAISARRHLIYTQAIKTLVSVRGRQTRNQQISEADLRTRLGTLALAIFRRQIAEIPRRAEVVALLASLMQRPPGADPQSSLADIADAFIQEVAEATGLVTLHAGMEVSSEQLVTFMHYSFLEYYAAAGLLSLEYLEAVPKLCSNPRWRDVVTLLFGMLSEQGDVTPLLERILSAPSAEEPITQFRLLLALDAAAECDVPPEQSQTLLARAVFETVAHGAARYSVELRQSIAGRLDHFLEGPGMRVESALVQGLRDEDPLSAAAFADLIARIDDTLTLSTEIAAAFDDLLDQANPVTRAAAMHAIEARRELRTQKARECVRKTLKGSLVEKHAALKVIAAIPAFGEELRTSVKELLEDPSPLISASAAECLLVDLIQNPTKPSESAQVERVIAKLGESSAGETGLSLQRVTLDPEAIKPLVLSDDAEISELAIRNLTLIRHDPQFVYDVLIRRIKMQNTPRQLAACLDALRTCSGAVNLITIADTDLICGQLRDSNRNVRIAAITLMGAMPDDEQVIQTLQDHFEKVVHRPSQQDELTAAARALAKHVRRNQKLRASTLSKLLSQLPTESDASFGDESQQHVVLTLLSVCESIGGITDDKAAWKLLRLAKSYRAPIELRCASIRVFGRLVTPAQNSVDAIIQMIKQDDPRLNADHYVAARAFSLQCKRRVEYVRRVYQWLAPLRDELCKAWAREISRAHDSINPATLNDIRDSITEVSNLIVSYEEFSGRAILK